VQSPTTTTSWLATVGNKSTLKINRFSHKTKYISKCANGQGPYTFTVTYWSTAICEKILRGKIPRGTIT